MYLGAQTLEIQKPGKTRMCSRYLDPKLTNPVGMQLRLDLATSFTPTAAGCVGTRTEG